MAKGSGTKADPWALKTPPGTSEFKAYRDDTVTPPALVVWVGKTELRYHLRSIDDLHNMLKSKGIWMLLGSADEQRRQLRERSKHGDAPPRTRSAGGTGSRKACGGVSGCMSRRCLRP